MKDTLKENATPIMLALILGISGLEVAKSPAPQNTQEINIIMREIEKLGLKVDALNEKTRNRWTADQHNDYAARQRDIDTDQSKAISDLRNNVYRLDNRINQLEKRTAQ